LGLLRLVREEKDNLSNFGALRLIQKWCAPASEEALWLRMGVYIQEECDAAIAFVNGTSTLTDEQKVGVVETIGKVRSAFGLNGFQTAVSSYIPQIDASISQLSFLVGNYGLSDNRRPPEADALVESIEQIIGAIDEAGVEPRVAEVARKHLHVLATLLRNVEVLGVDAAMAAYLELIIRLKRELDTAPAETRKTFAKLWPEIERWAGRIAIIEKAIENGGVLLHKAEGVVQLLLKSLN
jgi:hypothetical protein